MSYNTIIAQGNFTSDGTSKTIRLPQSVDWMAIYNRTVADDDQTTAIGVKYYWQRGFADGEGWEMKKSNAANAANLDDYLSSGGFTFVDSSASPNGALSSTVSSISNASIPVVTNSGDNGLSAGDVVRLIDVTGGQQLGGFDFTVGHNTLSSTTFSLDYMSQIASATSGSFLKVKFDPLYYPRHRYITKVTQASSAVVTMSVKHGYKVGQEVKFVVPDAYGMSELDGLRGTITAVDTTLATGNSITVDVDTSGFTAFAFPVTGDVPFSPAYVVPAGMDSPTALDNDVNVSSDASVNTGFIGMTLAAGADSPAGQNNDVVYWVAGKSISVDNE